MKRQYRNSCLGLILLTAPVLLSGCTLKLTTDLSKLIGIDNPSQLMQSEEAQQIATRIGEGMGTKIMEGEILAEDMGKGVGGVLLKPQSLPLVVDPVSVALIEANGRKAVQEGNYRAAISAFKRTNNRARLEEIALMLFDQGSTDLAADLHQYLADRGWPLRPPYLLAKQIEEEGLVRLTNPALQEVDPEMYNRAYTGRQYSLFDTLPLEQSTLTKMTVTRNEMLSRLRGAPLIILADTYFVVKQHTFFLELVTSLNNDTLIVGLELGLERLKANREVADKLNYLPLLNFIKNNGIATFTHGPLSEPTTGRSGATIDFFSWDTMIADTAATLLDQGKQVLVIIGDTHVSPAHLPFLIEKKTGINPALIVQKPLDISLETILAGEEPAGTGALAGVRVDEERVLMLGNDFYLAADLPPEDLQRYLELFNLERVVRKRSE